MVVRFLLAAYLALCVAVLPVSATYAAAGDMTAHAHSHQADVKAESHAAHKAAVSGAHVHAAQEQIGDPAKSGRADGAPCCGSLNCHAFEVSSGPTLGVVIAFSEMITIVSDPQVLAAFATRVDRPPKSV